ncbi:hypothetical protein BD408DRAFT_410502 [Parasitella parasitica]|nr:hypothetical protein BD408DRAFT_410502 [Parasitella parasitica]
MFDGMSVLLVTLLATDGVLRLLLEYAMKNIIVVLLRPASFIITQIYFSTKYNFRYYSLAH